MIQLKTKPGEAMRHDPENNAIDPLDVIPSEENLHVLLSPILEDMNCLVALQDKAHDHLCTDHDAGRFSWVDAFSFDAHGIHFFGFNSKALSKTLSNYRIENNSAKTTRVFPGFFNCSLETLGVFQEANALKRNIKQQAAFVKNWFLSHEELSDKVTLLHNKGLEHLIRSEVEDSLAQSYAYVKRALGGSRVNTKEVYRQYPILPVLDNPLRSAGWTVLKSHLSIKRITMYEAALLLDAKLETNKDDPGLQRQLAATKKYHPMTPVAITQFHTSPTIRLNYRFSAIKEMDDNGRMVELRPAVKGSCSGSLPVLYPTKDPVTLVDLKTAGIDKMHSLWEESEHDEVETDDNGPALKEAALRYKSLDTTPAFTAIRGYLYKDPDLRLDTLSDGSELPDEINW